MKVDEGKGEGEENMDGKESGTEEIWDTYCDKEDIWEDLKYVRNDDSHHSSNINRNSRNIDQFKSQFKLTWRKVQ